MNKTRIENLQSMTKLTQTQKAALAILIFGLVFINLAIPTSLKIMDVRAVATFIQLIFHAGLFVIPLVKLSEALKKREKATLITIIHFVISLKVAMICASPLMSPLVKSASMIQEVANKSLIQVAVMTVLYYMILNFFFGDKGSKKELS